MHEKTKVLHVLSCVKSIDTWGKNQLIGYTFDLERNYNVNPGQCVNVSNKIHSYREELMQRTQDNTLYTNTRVNASSK